METDYEKFRKRHLEKKKKKTEEHDKKVKAVKKAEVKRTPCTAKMDAQSKQRNVFAKRGVISAANKVEYQITVCITHKRKFALRGE